MCAICKIRKLWETESTENMKFYEDNICSGIKYKIYYNLLLIKNPGNKDVFGK